MQTVRCATKSMSAVLKKGTCVENRRKLIEVQMRDNFENVWSVFL